MVPTQGPEAGSGATRQPGPPGQGDRHLGGNRWMGMEDGPPGARPGPGWAPLVSRSGQGLGNTCLDGGGQRRLGVVSAC